jgi:hypothetical protein
MPGRRPAVTIRSTMQALAWYDELERIARNPAPLSPDARRAVKDVVVSILNEGARYPLRLERVVTALLAD